MLVTPHDGTRSVRSCGAPSPAPAARGGRAEDERYVRFLAPRQDGLIQCLASPRTRILVAGQRPRICVVINLGSASTPP